MAYTNGSITNADPAAALITVIEAQLTSHANWDAVEGYSLGGRAFTVWRNNGSGNSFGSDFYIVIEKFSTTEVRVRAAEGYTAASGVPANARLLKAIPFSTTLATGNTPLSDGSRAGSASVVPNDSSHVMYAGWIGLVTSGFDWFIIVSNDYLRVGVKAPAANPATVEVGLFDTLLPGGSGPVEPFPLYLAVSAVSTPNTSNSNNSAGLVGFSRHPNLPDLTARSYLWSSQVASQPLDYGPMIGGPGLLSGANSSDRFQGAGTVVYGLPIFKSTAAADGSLIGKYRGRPKDTIMVANDVVTPGLGDDWTLGSTVYIWWRMESAVSAWVKRDVT